MEHLRVRLVNDRQQPLQRVADGKYLTAFLFSKTRQMEVLQFF